MKKDSKKMSSLFVGIQLMLGLSLNLNLASTAQAQGQGTGNGGGAVVKSLADGSLEWAKSLDLYEGALFLKMEYVTAANYEEVVQATLSKAAIYQRDFANSVLVEANRLMESIRNEQHLAAPYAKMVDVPLEKVLDVRSFALPTDCLGCSAEQAAVRLTQEQSTAYSGIRYAFQRKIWNSMDPLNKSALILHEAVYKVLNSDDSLAVRRIVRVLLSKDGFNFVTLTDALAASKYKSIVPSLEGSSYLKASEFKKLDEQRVVILFDLSGQLKLKLVYDSNGRIDRDQTEALNESRSMYSLRFENCETGLLKNKRKILTGTLIRNNQPVEFKKLGYSAMECRGVTHLLDLKLRLFEEIEFRVDLQGSTRWVSGLSVNFHEVLPIGSEVSGTLFSGPWIQLLAPKLRLN